MRTSTDVGVLLTRANCRPSEILDFPIDLNGILSQHDGDIASITAFLVDVEENGQRQWADFRRSFMARDDGGAATGARVLRLNAEKIGAFKLEQIAGTMEEVMAGSDKRRKYHLYLCLHAELHRCLCFIAAFRYATMGVAP
jgi:hypothetical protein